MRHSVDPMGPLNPQWTTERRKPKGREAKLHELGTIAQCVAGDVVACESLDGQRFIWLEIAWQWPDGKAAMARIYDRKAREISLLAPFMRTVYARQRVRWVGLRVK